MQPAPEGIPPPEITGHMTMPMAPPMDEIIAAGPLQLGPEGTMGSLGVNYDSYLDSRADQDTRLSRVERAVTALHRDVKTLAPPILRLITVERDIQALVAQLAELTQAPAVPASAPAAYIPTPVSPAGTTVRQPAYQPAATAPKQTGSGGMTNTAGKGSVTVHKLRTGEHPDKTRIVLDVSGPASYRYDLDNKEHLLVIELPGANWAAPTQWKAKSKSPLLASYSVTPMDNGQRVVIQLKKDTSVKYETVIKANGYKDYRIVIDLKK
ncbi:MAG: AMIN domain-containing protein [Rhodospirillales bacterium]|nr:AMIN domain-containing protein [Rhodospirillales bacterium]MCB9996206.1 AMIN domain-containing protein [Rhodospirillales bacterium]